MPRQLEKFTRGPMLPRMALVTLSELGTLPEDASGTWWQAVARKQGMTSAVFTHNADGAMSLSTANDELTLPEGVWKLTGSIISANEHAANTGVMKWAIVNHVDGASAVLYFESTAASLPGNAVADDDQFRDTKSVVVTLTAPTRLTVRAVNNTATDATIVMRAGCQLLAEKIANLNEG